MKDYMSLQDIAAALRVRSHRVQYAVANSLVPEPALKIGNRRIFQAEDLRRLAEYFGLPLPDDEPVAGAGGRNQQ
jgi:hypothetical protein